MDIQFSKQAKKYLQKMTHNQRVLIIQAILKIPEGHITPLRGYKHSLKLRVNSYRVVFQYKGDILSIEMILKRGDVYKSGY